MNYHLHRHGQDADAISLEELARLRQSGELTGAEMVWREGMPQWEPLDKILALHGNSGASTPPPLPRNARKKKGSSRTLITSIILIGLLFLGCAAFVVVKFTQRVREMASFTPAGRSEAMTAASKPVEWTTNTITAKEFKARQRDFRIRQYLGGYEKNGVRNPTYDAKAIGFITNWINCNHNGPVNTNLLPLNELGDALANDPTCNEPLLLTIAANQAVELHESIRRLERAVTGFRNSKHSGYPKFYASVLLSDKLLVDKKDRQPVLDAEALQYFKQFLTEKLSPHDQEDVAENLLYGWADDFFARNAVAVCDAVHDAGEPYQWLELVLRGDWEIKAAWKARGGGYANTVSGSGWQGFRDHLAKAREHLTAAWKLHPDSPFAPSKMIYVSLGDSDITEMRLWFDRVMAARIDYPGAWGHLRWGLRPRWYGDTDSMLALGVTALNTKRYDTDVPRMFFDVLTDLEAEQQVPIGMHIYWQPDVWPRLQEMYEGYIAASDSEERKAGWRSTYAVVAHLARQPDVARKQLEAIQWKLNENNLGGWGSDLSFMAGEVAARTGPHAKEVKTAESNIYAYKFDEVIATYTRLAQNPDTDAPSRSFFSNRIATVKIRNALKGGQWADFLPADESLVGWRSVQGNFRRLPDGSLEVQSDQSGHMLYSPAYVGRDFEVEGSFEVVSNSNSSFQAGLVMGLPDWNSSTWYAFRIKRNSDEGDVSSFSDGWSKEQLLSPIKLDSKTNSFSFRFHNGSVSAKVNGTEVFNSVKPPKNSKIPRNEFYLGLGAFNDMNTTVIRYRDVRVRQLSKP